MPGRLEFGFDFSTSAVPRERPGDEAPFRILVAGPFSGRGRDGDDATPSPSRIDIDNFDVVLHRFAPTVAAGTDGGHELDFECLDDFHPDELYARSPLFAALRKTRRDLADRQTFAAAYARLAVDDAAESPPVAGETATSASAFEALLGGKPDSPTGRAQTGIDRLIRSAVEPFIEPGADPRQDDAIAALDQAIAAEMRALLRDPQFRALESAWRAVSWLVSAVDDETVQVFLLDADAAMLAQAAPSAERPTTPLFAALEAKAPWGAICGLFEPGADAVADGTLAGAAALAGRLGAPLLGGVSPTLLGAADWETFARDPATLDDAAVSAWREFRASPAAPLVGLAGPRMLLRLPYGASTDPIDAFAFEECIAPDETDALLWGSAGIAVARLLAEAFADEGWSMSGAGHQRLDDLPAYSYRLDGEMHLVPAVGVYLVERAAEALLALGVMPLVAARNAAVVQLLRVQSVASPAAALHGTWTG